MHRNGDLFPRRRGLQRGFTLMEVALALVIFLMMTFVFAAAFPLVSRQAQASSNSTQAAMIAQHKLDQLRSEPFILLQNPGTGNSAGTLQTLGVIDANSLSGASVPYTATFTGVDGVAATGTPGSGYFPAGATGTIQVQDLKTVNPAISAPAGVVFLVTVTIQWPSGGTVGGRYVASTLVAANGEK